MLLVISPAKKLDFSPVEIENNLSKPLFQKDATNLANVASKLSKSELKQLMSISDKLADLNFQRFQSFKNIQLKYLLKLQHLLLMVILTLV